MNFACSTICEENEGLVVNEESKYKWGRTGWGVDQDLLGPLEGKEPHIHCTRCVLNKLYIMFTREKSDCFVIIFQGGLHLLYEIILAIQQSVLSGMILVGEDC